MPKLQSKGKQKAKNSPTKRNPKRRKVTQDSLEIESNDSANAGSLPPPSADVLDRSTMETEINIKFEPEDDHIESDLPAEGVDEEVLEAVKIEEVDDPLTIDASIKIEDDPVKEKCCDEGFTPGNAENLPKVDALAATEFLQPLTDGDKKRVRALWQQSRTRWVSTGQLDVLWEFFNSHRYLTTASNRSHQAKEYAKQKWSEIAAVLNAQIDGAYKEWYEWSKYWTDFKSKLKRRIIVLRAQSDKGEGPSTEQPLTEIESKFLQLLGEDFGQGLPGARVEPFTQNSMSTDTTQIKKIEEVPIQNMPVYSTRSTASLPTPPAPTPPAPTLPVPTPPAPTLPAPSLPVPSLPAPRLPVPTLPVPTLPVPAPPAPRSVRSPRRRQRRQRRDLEPPVSQETRRHVLVESSRIRAEASVRAGIALEKIQNTLERIERPREHINETIGYVQLRRDGPICTINCVVATKYSENNCVLVYNEMRCAIETIGCDCIKIQCNHVLTALIWLCSQRTPGSYWMEPIITKDPMSMTLNAIFGFPKIIYRKKNTVLADFVKECKQNKDFTPTLMKYYLSNEILKASLHNLMKTFKTNSTELTDVESFLYFCRENINLEDADLRKLAPEARRELVRGRITDSLLYDVSVQPLEEFDIEALIEIIISPDNEENEEINPAIIECLENSLKMKIKKCGMIVSSASPIFAAFPYGITDTHVVYIKFINDDSSFNDKKLDPRNTACMQLQMYVTNRQIACFCAVHSNNRIDILVVKYNQNMMHDLLKKAAKFWKKHIFKCIAMD